MWAELEDVKSGKVQLSLSWLEATMDKSVLQGWYLVYIFFDFILFQFFYMLLIAHRNDSYFSGAFDIILKYIAFVWHPSWQG